MKQGQNPEEVCKRCSRKRSDHGINDMCPPYSSNCTTFIATDKPSIKATDMVHAFENEYVARYPHMRYFTADTVITDILHWRNEVADKEARESLMLFLTRYLKEHPDRFQYAGMFAFRVIANIPSLERVIKKVQQSPN